MLNLDEPNDSQGTCSARSEERRNKKKKKRSRVQNTLDDDVHSDAVPQIQTRRRRGPQGVDPRTQGPQDGRQHTPNMTSTSRQQEMRLYMDKLRELIPHLPKHGKMPQTDVIQTTIDYICDLQRTLESHPRLQGLDPRVIAAPGNSLPPMQMQQLLLQQRKQQRVIQLQQQQWRLQLQQQYQQRDQYPQLETYQHQHFQRLGQFQQSDQYGELDHYEQQEQREYQQSFIKPYQQQQQQQPRQYQHLQHLQQQHQQQLHDHQQHQPPIPHQHQHHQQQHQHQQQQHQHQQHQHQQQQYQHQQQYQQQPQQIQQRDALSTRRPLSTIATTPTRSTLQLSRTAQLPQRSSWTPA
ncbi:Myc-type basic helix-loop-helix (bHLH) domain [Trinorchestia longiramus]|nr:Myc-type basic helix-loop-helix (bHLH) domain [Trinorchestia longiramus]